MSAQSKRVRVKQSKVQKPLPDAPLSRLYGSILEDRDPEDAIVEAIPWMESDVTCEACGSRFNLLRMMGDDPNDMECPYCAARSVEFTDEANVQMHALH